MAAGFRCKKGIPAIAVARAWYRGAGAEAKAHFGFKRILDDGSLDGNLLALS
jgi:hypothetical protein